MSIEKSCGIMVYHSLEKEQKFLLLQSRINNHWSFPKGNMEIGETEKETAIREVFEETGLPLSVVEGFKTSCHYKLENGNLKEVIFFLGEATEASVQIQVVEIMDYKWLNQEEAIMQLTFENVKLILKEAIQFINEKK